MRRRPGLESPSPALRGKGRAPLHWIGASSSVAWDGFAEGCLDSFQLLPVYSSFTGSRVATGVKCNALFRDKATGPGSHITTLSTGTDADLEWPQCLYRTQFKTGALQGSET